LIFSLDYEGKDLVCEIHFADVNRICYSYFSFVSSLALLTMRERSWGKGCSMMKKVKKVMIFRLAIGRPKITLNLKKI
jgi:hypothetical protein